MMDPIVLAYAKGQMTGFLANPEGVLDVVSSWTHNSFAAVKYMDIVCWKSYDVVEVEV